MGDRCYVQISFRNRAAAEAFGLAANEGPDFWNDILTDDDHEFAVGIDECNYGWDDQMVAAAKAGVEFMGNHGPGFEYPSEDFVTSDGEVLYQEVGRYGYTLPIEVTKKGDVRIQKDAIPLIKKFLAAEIALRKKWAKS